MEALLQIIENTEKNQLDNKRKDDDGINQIYLPQDDGCARNGMSFFGADNMYSNIIANGEEPAFPSLEDMPRSEHVSFDVHYFATSNNKVHRITLTRAHGPEDSFIKACFVDGNLVFMCGAGRGKLKVYLFNSTIWDSGAVKGAKPRFWFHVDNQRVDVIANAYFSVEKSLWMGSMAKSPAHYGIFINDQSTVNRNSTLAQYQIQNTHYWASVLSVALLLPVWITWMLFDSFFILPVQQCRSHCEVRRFWIRPERDWFCQNAIDATVEPGETTRLLG